MMPPATGPTGVLFTLTGSSLWTAQQTWVTYEPVLWSHTLPYIAIQTIEGIVR